MSTSEPRCNTRRARPTNELTHHFHAHSLGGLQTEIAKELRRAEQGLEEHGEEANRFDIERIVQPQPTDHT